MSALRLRLLPGRLAVCRLDPAAPVPAWAASGELVAITRTAAELSIVCAEHAAPVEVRAERGWRALGIRGPLDFSLTGILLSCLQPLAAVGISIFAISTFDTDYVLVKEESLAPAAAALRAAGHEVETSESS